MLEELRKARSNVLNYLTTLPFPSSLITGLAWTSELYELFRFDGDLLPYMGVARVEMYDDHRKKLMWPTVVLYLRTIQPHHVCRCHFTMTQRST